MYDIFDKISCKQGKGVIRKGGSFLLKGSTKTEVSASIADYHDLS